MAQVEAVSGDARAEHMGEVAMSRFTFSTILAFVVAVFMPYTASAADVSAAAALVTARVAAEQQLVSLGIDPGDAVFQVGSRNYAGPNCPGSGWNCTSAATVVQIGAGTAPSAINYFQCHASPMTPGVVGTPGPGSCTIVQTNTTGTNDARCVEALSTNPATQECNITQTNVSAANRALVIQLIFQHEGSQDVTQTATQAATVHQGNTDGANESAVTQSVGQNASKYVEGSTGAQQTQEAHQRIQVCQGAAGNPCFGSSHGTNRSAVNQNNVQRAIVEFDEVATGVVIQKQNTQSLGPVDGPKSYALVRQHTLASTNDAALHQFNRQIAAVRHSWSWDDDEREEATIGFQGPVTQKQGSGDTCPRGGLCGFEFQNSTGVQTLVERQDEVQRLVGPKLSTTSQIQFGPEFCCATQIGGNNASVNNITQLKAQFRTTFPAISSAQGDEQGHCNSPSTDGNNCNVTQRLTQNGVVTNNSCAGALCNIAISCTQGFEGGCFNSPPGPPPPVPCPAFCD